MDKETYKGLTHEEVRQRVAQGLVNETNNSVSKTTSQIVRTHTLTYFNFLNLFLGGLILFTGQIKNLTFLGVMIVNTIIGIIK